MKKNMLRFLLIECGFLLMVSLSGFGKTVIFFENGFPSVENGAISRATLEQALASMDPVFVGIDSLNTNLHPGDLLVLPYGSAFPADAWSVIESHLRSGNVLIIGGRPLYVPVYREGMQWRIDPGQNSFSKNIGIMYSYVAPEKDWTGLKWDVDAPFFTVTKIDAKQVFVNAGFGGRYRGLGYFVDATGERLSSPVTADDMIFGGLLRRNVYLSFNASSDYWDSEDGIELIRDAAEYASLGGLRLYLDISSLCIDPGDRVAGSVDVLRNGPPALLTVEILLDTKILEKKNFDCGNSFHHSVDFTGRLEKPGMYTVRAMLSIGGTVFDQYTSGVEVRQPGLIQSGVRLGVGKDYFNLDGKPYLPVGANYFSTDPYGRAFFTGQSIGGNAYVWEHDFAEMEKDGLTIVRTGIWLNRFRYLEQVSGASTERLLDAIEAYLSAAARHHIQVIFTFFAFNPGEGGQRGDVEQENTRMQEINPYLNPNAVERETTYVHSIVSRFMDVPFLSYDLINEPSFANFEHVWKGNSPTNDPVEVTAWQHWLEQNYSTVDSLANAWHVSPDELGAFNKVKLPDFDDLQQKRDDNTMSVRAEDYNHFAQFAFNSWADVLIKAIRSTGSTQLAAVGQDEGGVTDRVLDQFIATSDVSYTDNHTWWQDDALLWDSVVPKTFYKANLIEETGPQPVWSLDGTWRLHDMNGFGLEERKLVLAFANAGAGVIHWDWTHLDDFGLFRRDGSQETWLAALKGIASFAHDAEPYTTEAKLPEVALVIPQSLQLSTFNRYSIEVQQKAVRALYNYARGTAFAVGEYQLDHMPDAKLIIVPSPWVLNQGAWDKLMTKVKNGTTLLISGRVDADEHWRSVPSRTKDWEPEYSEEALRTRYADIAWSGDSARVSFSGDKTTYLDRGVLEGNKTFVNIKMGSGHILYFALPLEMADQLNVIGQIYKFAMRQAGVTEAYSTTCSDPGMLICPTELPGATLYVFTSESANTNPIQFHDRSSGADFTVHLAPGRGALMMVAKDGKVIASYNVH
jgi:hypothetical protein